MTKHLFLLGAFAVLAAGSACDRVVDLIVVPDGGFPLDIGVIDTTPALDAPPFSLDAPPFSLDAPPFSLDAPFSPSDALFVAPPGP
jgi:hypothetical protein